MAKYLNRFFILGTTLLISTLSLSPLDAQQGGEQVAQSWIDTFQLAPLDTLIYRAIMNAPALKAKDASIDQKRYTLKLNNMNWMDWIKGTGVFSYGTGNTLSSDVDGEGSAFSLSTRVTAVYNAGLSIAVSPYDLLSRNREKKKLKQEILQARYEKDDMIQQLVEEVIKRYQSFQLQLELLKRQISSLEASKLSFQIAEKYFREGNLSIPDYNSALESKLKSEIAYETVRVNVKESLALLENIVGGEVTNQ